MQCRAEAAQEAERKEWYVAFSRSMCRIPFLEAFLNAGIRYRNARDASAVAGWGHKPTADYARSYAKKSGLPYIAVEDGFLRSVGLGCNGAAPLSLVVDKTGIYYDAAGPSDLENLLNKRGWEKPDLLASAEKAMDSVIRHGLSKYNQAPDARPGMLGDSDTMRVLLIDQTYGDSSVQLGMADARSFIAMAQDAEKLFPDAVISVKTHPDVLAGKKRGYLSKYAAEHHLRIIAEDVSPLSLLSQADEVFCVTSQMGFEALMLGKRVHCYGMPFYAGWGATIDALACPRRAQRRSVQEIFAAAYMMYARYVDPIEGRLCDIHAHIERLALQKEKELANRGYHACFGYSQWKHPHARAFLQSSGASFGFFKHFRAAERAVKNAVMHHGDVVAWSSKCADGTLENLCVANGVPLTRMEDGFIRSVGLGSDFQWPYSLVLDRSGIYYDPGKPSDLEKILNGIKERTDHDALCLQAQELIDFIVKKGLTKYNVGSDAPFRDTLPENKAIVLVPGQVEDDASVRRGGGKIQSNLALLRAVREKRPDAFIIYKPHPDVEVRNRKGRIPDEEARKVADAVVRGVRMDVVLGCVDEVHTLTSLTGFEALLRGIRVSAYGGPFYAGWGLTQDYAPEDSEFLKRRTARLSLDELAAGALLLYPSYYDWKTSTFCSAGDVCKRMLEPDARLNSNYLLRIFASIRKCARKWM